MNTIFECWGLPDSMKNSNSINNFHTIWENIHTKSFAFTYYSLMNYFFSQFTHGFAQKSKQTETNHTDGPQSAEVEIVST